MNRLDILLVFAVVASALGLVQSQHQAREQFAALERLKTEALELDEIHGSLAIELSTWADPARVDQVASAQLGLVAPVPERMATLDLSPEPVAPLDYSPTPAPAAPQRLFASDTVALVAPAAIKPRVATEGAR